MDKQRMIFEIDRRKVTEGDIVEITWQCEGADSVSLTLDNGFKTTDIALETSGNKRFRLNRSKGLTKLTLTVKIQGKEHHKTIRVRVKKMPTIKAETIDHNGRKMGWMKQWWQKIVTKWHEATAKYNQALQILPPKKQIAVKLLILISFMLLISAIWPKFYTFTLVALALYLTITLLRR